MPSFLVTWLLAALSLVITAYIVPGFVVKSLGAALIAAVILGLVNAIVRPLIILLTLPLTIVTLGFFLFIVNAISIWIAGVITPGFAVTNFFAALIGSLVLSIVSSALNFFFKTEDSSRD